LLHTKIKVVYPPGMYPDLNHSRCVDHSVSTFNSLHELL